MRWLVLPLMVLASCSQDLCAAPEHDAFRVSATLQRGQVRLGGIVRVTLRLTGVHGEPINNNPGWPAWWQIWQVRSPGAVLDPVAIWTTPQYLHSRKVRVWHIQLYVRKGGGKTVLQFGLRRCADHWALQKKPGVAQRIYWRPHTPRAKILWTKPLGVNIGQTPGLSAAQAAGPLQVQILLHTYKPQANTWDEADLVVKNITKYPTAFEAASCKWFVQWHSDSTAVARELYGCSRNILIRHVLAPGRSFHWKTKLQFRPSPRQCIFRMGFTPLQPHLGPHLPGHGSVRTYWSEPIHVTVYPKHSATDTAK